jgi:acetyl esterase/lipase
MRKWINEQYIPLPKAPINERIRPQALVTSKDISISYGKDNTFSVRVYTPTYQNTRKETLRPALMMIHGGGFIHGSPEVDDGEKHSRKRLHEIGLLIDNRHLKIHNLRSECHCDKCRLQTCS